MLTSFQSAFLETTHVGLEPNWKAAVEFLRTDIRGDICDVLFLHKTGATEVLAESNPGIAQIRPYREANHSGATTTNDNPYFVVATRLHSNSSEPFVAFADALVPLDIIQKSPFYQNVMAPVGMNDAVGALFYDGGQLLGKICLLRSSVKTRFGAMDAERIRSISKFISEGLLRSRRIRTLRMMNIANTNSPSQLRHGAMVFDTRANILDMYGIGENVIPTHGDHIRKIVKEFAASHCIGQVVESTAVLTNTGLTNTGVRGTLTERETPAFQYYIELAPVGGRTRIICYLQRTGIDVESYYRIPSGVTLTPRESDVITFLVRGSDNATIAKQMGIGVYTVKDHLKSIFQKLGVHTRAGAVALLTRGVRPMPVEDIRN